MNSDYISWVKEKLDTDRLRRMLISWALQKHRDPLFDFLAPGIVETCLTEDIYTVILKPDQVLSIDHIEAANYISGQVKLIFSRCPESVEK